jgi:hypothetical protein
MEQFVRVRMVQGNGMDLSLFQFDYDLTFAAFFMNSDKLFMDVSAHVLNTKMKGLSCCTKFHLHLLYCSR